CYLAPAGSMIVSGLQVEGVGLYFRQQLLQSRHRGAFELAYVGFVRLTDMLCRSGSRVLQQLPSRWLSEVLEEVKCSDPSSKLCATRRSAGIPFYIQALLSSEPKSSSCSLLKMTMRELTALAMPSADRNTDSSTVPQVHALNILRALYRDTRLGENIIPFVSDGVQAAVLGFTSPVWAVRNSSTLLFSALITRIFGVKRGKDEHSKKNRSALSLFDSGHVKLHPSLFLLLLVLSRLYPSPMDGSSSPLGLAPFMPFIMRCGRSAVYRTREMAARALVPFVLVTQVPSTVGALLQELPSGPGPTIQHNRIHGTLLQVCSHWPVFFFFFLSFRQNCCLVTRGAYLNVVLCLCGQKINLLQEVCSLRQKTLSVLLASELLASDPPRDVGGPGSVQYLLSLAQVALSASIELPDLWDSSHLAPQLLERLLRCPQYEVRELAAESILRRLKEEEEEEEDKGRPLWLDETTLSNLTSLALHEQHPQCLAKVLQVLSEGSCGRELLWRDGEKSLSRDEVLLHLLNLTQSSTFRLVKQYLTFKQRNAAVACLAPWGALVCSCCDEERPVEVKLTATKVLVGCTSSLLTDPGLVLGLPTTLSLWRSLFLLLQDEDQEVRDSASDFTSQVPAHLLSTAAVPVCPPAALEVGVELLCRLFELWGQMGAGVLVLMQWLLGEEDEDEGPDEASSLDFLFEKGDRNLWAEPLLWVKLLHRHLRPLVLQLDRERPDPEQLVLMEARARAEALRSQQALESLPALPQFCCAAEHARLTLRQLFYVILTT
uniref:tRNA (32-2'-O)-methyltransferase regulator THADA n=1 Tax=Oryzias sinensis TaxID=183150 RepID=A0A8C7YBV7_9TELE